MSVPEPSNAETAPTPWFRAQAPFLAAVALYAGLLARATTVAMARTDGVVRYGCDDAYIHLAFAKQLAAGGGWGVSGGEFAHASSSPLWVVLLTGLFEASGPFDAAPFVLNVAASLGVLWVLHRALAARRVGPRPAVLAMAFFVLATRLSYQTLMGMEHVVQLLADLVFALLVARMLDGESPRPRDAAVACAVAAVAVATRLEAAFLVGAGALLLVLRRGRWGTGAALLACGAAPVVAMGLLAKSHGWGFLPTSIALKGEMPSLTTARGILNALGGHGLANWTASSELIVVTLLALAALACVAARTDGRRTGAAAILVMTCVVVALHCQCARVEARYTSYLVGLGVGGLLLAAPDLPAGATRTSAARIAWAAALVPIAWRGAFVEMSAPVCVKNIFEQQGQLARFFAEPRDGAVALNDIGAVAWWTPTRIVDVSGLATLEVAQTKMAGSYTTERFDEICRAHDVRVAAIYDAWFDGEPDRPLPPKTWTRVGTWRIHDNVACGTPVVTFYAAVPAETEPLRARFRAFAATLPAGVTSTAE